MKDLGPTLNPLASFLLIQGLETLSLRVQRHCENALALALWLQKHPRVSWVSYLGLPTHPSHELAKKQCRRNAYGGVLSFGVKGDAKTSSKVVDSLKLASNLANVGECIRGLSIPIGQTQILDYTRRCEDPCHPSSIDNTFAAD